MKKNHVIEKLNPSLLLVDGFNLFYISYYTNKTINSNGDVIGGILGFLISLAKIIKSTSPNETVIVFDGVDAGKRKKEIIKEYKANRDGKVKNIVIEGGYEIDNFADQLGILLKILDSLSIRMLIIDNYEADDVIGYLVRKNIENNNIYVCSTDKDYYQLIEYGVRIYNPSLKRFITSEDVKKKFGDVLVENIIYYRSLVGDSSDNIKGVNGIGKKNVTKIIPQLSNKKINGIGEFIDIIKENENDSKLSLKIKENTETIKKIFTITTLNGYSSFNEKFYSQIKEQLGNIVVKSNMKSRILFDRYGIGTYLFRKRYVLNILLRQRVLNGKIKIKC